MATKIERPFGFSDAELEREGHKAAADPQMYWHNFRHKIDVAISRAIAEHGRQRADLVSIGLNHELAKLRIVLDGRSTATQQMRAAHQRLAAANYRAELAGIPRTFLDGIQRATSGPDEAAKLRDEIAMMQLVHKHKTLKEILEDREEQRRKREEKQRVSAGYRI